jgi:tRNA dimethylallyltransferase
VVAKKLELVAIIGPTASGKTGLAIEIAKKYNGEIISADSRAIYKYLDIGSAKPSLGDRQGVPHWGFDLSGPGRTYSVSDFQVYAKGKIQEIKTRGHLPIIAGGSGLYIDAVLYNFSFAPTDAIRRKTLELKTVEQLQEQIRQEKLDMPENSLNKRYLVRALERKGRQTERSPLPEGYLIIGINPGRDILAQRIEERTNLMIAAGVVDEIVQASQHYGWGSEAMTGGIYKVFKDYIDGKATLEESKAMFIRSDLKLVKKQLTWFKRNADIRWFNDAEQAMNWFDKTFRGKLE